MRISIRSTQLIINSFTSETTDSIVNATSCRGGATKAREIFVADDITSTAPFSRHCLHPPAATAAPSIVCGVVYATGAMAIGRRFQIIPLWFLASHCMACRRRLRCCRRHRRNMGAPSRRILGLLDVNKKCKPHLTPIPDSVQLIKLLFSLVYFFCE